MSKEQLTAILKISTQNSPPRHGGAAALRAWFEAINAETPIAEGSIIEKLTLGPCNGELIRVPASDDHKLVIYFHDGGFIFGSPRSYRVVTTNLARTSGARVLSVDYRLAPEHPAPAAHEDAFAAYRWALARGHAPGSIALGGDSAGGNMALATAVEARDAGLPLPACLVLMSPALDLAGDGESHGLASGASLLTSELMAMFLAVYVGDGDPRAPVVTPFHSDMSRLPPVLIHVGSMDILRDDSIAITKRINAAGGDAELKVWDGMSHFWQLFAPRLDEGMASIEEAGAFVKRHLDYAPVHGGGGRRHTAQTWGGKDEQRYFRKRRSQH